MLKIVVLGYGEMFLSLLSGCMASDVGNVVGVFRHDRIKYSNFKLFFKDLLNPSKEFSYIKSLKIHEIKAKSVNSQEFKQEILKLNPDIILIGTWGEKLKKEIFDLPKMATINLHPSLLPKYRGPNPYLQVIKNGEEESGFTFHLVDKNFDTGGILYQKTIKISPEETGKSLKEKMVALVRPAVIELLDRLDDDIIIPLAQNPNKASYFPQTTADDIMIDFTTPAKEIYAKIRAFYSWNNCFFAYKNNFFIPQPDKTEILWQTDAPIGKIVEKDPKTASLTIVCGDNKMIKFSNLKLYGKFAKYFTKLYIKFCVKI